MGSDSLDDVDRATLHLLRADARKNANTAIADRMGVAASTVSTRITKLEEQGIIDGDHPKSTIGTPGCRSTRSSRVPPPSPSVGNSPTGRSTPHGVVDVRETIAGNGTSASRR
ncbi:winged helix-turn-helix transcriptional regulator [Halorarum salinum]|uniref:Winged helix-turn-helix transcriptional regulator n=1 Tax=Halorarum salinum TaxID=2743089 RepID=A0A7D5L9P8_9EURY|nr:winged helix-turn-helix transcriptional regulator [Halobaculum salinum]